MKCLSAVLGGALLLVGLSACASPPVDPASGAAAGDTSPTAAGACDAGTLSWTIGQVADDALVERARTEAGATVVRVLRPGMLITNDVNPMRLNLRVDNERKVLSCSCG